MTEWTERPPIGVVVSTYDAPPELLERCVASLCPSLHLSDRVVVVDTGGAASARLEDAGWSERVEVIDLGANRGVGGAINEGVHQLLEDGIEYVAVLDDDVIVEPGWADPLVAELQANRRLGAVQPLIVQLGVEPPVIDSAGVDIDRFGAVSHRLRGAPARDAQPAQLAAATGSAAMWSAACIRDIGPVDERFFLYYEDVDWCRRGTRRGWGFSLVPSSVVAHQGSATTQRLGAAGLQLQERNRLWSVASNGSVREILAASALSIRRLRHRPYGVHARSLASGLFGGAARLIRAERPKRSSAMIDHPPVLLRRAVSGVNVLGYHHVSSGLGDSARAIVRCLRAAGVDVVEIDNDATLSPRIREARPIPAELHDTTIAVVTALEWSAVMADHPFLRSDGRRLIGYWWWELEEVPVAHVEAMSELDEVWCGSEFTARAYRSAAPAWLPVRHAPCLLPEAVADESLVAAHRAQWGDATVFLVTFDYLSTPERKNPLASIAAYREAFSVDDGALLIIKSINGAQRPDAVQSLRMAAGDRPDIVMLDQHLDEASHRALLAAADVLVSPHRSEGFGLQTFAALALGTAVVATNYGGVLDYLDNSNALLIDFDLVDLVDGAGIYPEGARWADVSRSGLADAMRQLFDEPSERQRLAEAGEATVASLPDERSIGRAYRELLESAEPRTRRADAAGLTQRDALRERRRRTVARLWWQAR